MFKNKKLFAVLFITLILLFFSVSSCFASTDLSEYTVNCSTSNEYGKSIFIPSVYSNSIITMSNGLIQMFVKPSGYENYVFVKPTSGNIALYDSYECNTKVRVDHYYLRNSDDSNLSFSNILDHDYMSTCGAQWVYAGDIGSVQGNFLEHVLYNADIYNTDNTLFFLAPVQAVPLQGEIAQKLEGVEMSQVMKEIVGVLPLIIVVVVSLVGLRKALTMLSTLLHKA